DIPPSFPLLSLPPSPSAVHPLFSPVSSAAWEKSLLRICFFHSPPPSYASNRTPPDNTVSASGQSTNLPDQNLLHTRLPLSLLQKDPTAKENSTAAVRSYTKAHSFPSTVHKAWHIPTGFPQSILCFGDSRRIPSRQ